MSTDHLVFALNQTARVALRCDVLQANIVRQAAKKRDAFSDEHGHASHDNALHETGAQESLDCYPTVNVEVVGAAGRQFCDNLRRLSAHLLDHDSAHDRQIEWAAAQHHDALLTIGPDGIVEDNLEGLVSDHDRIDGLDELVIAMRFAAAWRQKIKGAVRPCEKAIQTGSNKDRYEHGRPPCGGATIQPRHPEISMSTKRTPAQALVFLRTES